jgi:hypothetical protein
VPYASTQYDGSQGQIPTACVIPQFAEPITFKIAVASTAMDATSTAPSFFCGLSNVSTTIFSSGDIYGSLTNYIGLFKNKNSAQFYIVSNKASGTVQKTAIPGLTALTANYWYDICFQIVKDNTTVGAGYVDVWWDVNLPTETAYTNGPYRIYLTGTAGSLLPDTVAMAPSWATVTGASGVTNYLDYFVFQLGL